MITTSFEALGRRADIAAGNVAKARVTVLAFGSAERAAENLQVHWTNRTWDNGLIELGNALQAVIVSRLDELLPAALEILATEAADSAQAMREAMMGSAVPGEGERAVPRQLAAQHEPMMHEPAAEPLKASTGNTPTGPGPDLVVDPYGILDNPVREVLDWVAANPGKRLAKTPERSKLEELGYLTSTGTPPNNTWDLSEKGREVIEGKARTA